MTQCDMEPVLAGWGSDRVVAALLSFCPTVYARKLGGKTAVSRNLCLSCNVFVTIPEHTAFYA